MIKIGAGSLYYSIRKKLNTQYLRDMTQLASKVRQIERLKDKNTNTSNYTKDKISYVDTEEYPLDFFKDYV